MKRAVLLSALLLVGCEKVVWAPEQVAALLDHCENNGGIESIITFPANREMYMVICEDGAEYRLKTGINEE